MLAGGARQIGGLPIRMAMPTVGTIAQFAIAVRYLAQQISGTSLADQWKRPSMEEPLQTAVRRTISHFYGQGERL